jgi:hypothetical protein
MSEVPPGAKGTTSLIGLVKLTVPCASVEPALTLARMTNKLVKTLRLNHGCAYVND